MPKRNTLFRTIIIMIFALAELTGAASVSLAQTLTLGQAAGSVLKTQYDESALQPAQSSLDVEPPLIEHEVITQTDAAIRQTFLASVVDDQELDIVQLFYRFDGETRYTRSLMNRVSYSSTWIAQIATDPSNPQDMEYYIQAKDKSGNRTVRGYAFSPLIREVLPLATAEAPVDSPKEVTKTSTSGGRKVLYVVGGVLLLGLLAAAASGSGGSSDDPMGGEICNAGRCTVTITTERPF